MTWRQDKHYSHLGFLPRLCWCYNSDYKCNECREETLIELLSCQENTDSSNARMKTKIIFYLVFECHLWHYRFIVWGSSSFRFSLSWWIPKERESDLYNRQRSFSPSFANLRCSWKPWIREQHFFLFVLLPYPKSLILMYVYIKGHCLKWKPKWQVEFAWCNANDT